MRRNWGTLPKKTRFFWLTATGRQDDNTSQEVHFGCSPSTLGTSLYGFEESTAQPVPVVPYSHS